MKQRSCLAKMAISCLGLCVFMVALVVLAISYRNMNKAKAPEMATLDTVTTIPENTGLLGNASIRPEQKPIRVELNFEGASIEVVAGNSNSIDITGDYDRANFKLQSEVESQDGSVVCKVTFKSNRLLWPNIISTNSGVTRNRLLVRLPKHQLMDLEINHQVGNLDVDLGGLAITDLDLDMSKGSLDLSSSSPNLVVLDHLQLNATMGKFRINDIQNFRFKTGSFDGKAGEMTIANSGDFLEPEVYISMNMMLGSSRLELPRNVQTQRKALTRRGNSESNSPDKPPTLVHLDGAIGEHTITFETRRPSIDHLVKSLFRDNEHPEEAIAKLRETYHAASDAYDFREISLNQLGYLMLRRNQVDAAIALFKFNVEIHPDYANGFDSLAEGYMEGGYNEQAILNYEKSIEMNPLNHSGKLMLRKLRGQINYDMPPEAPEPPKPPEDGNY